MDNGSIIHHINDVVDLHCEAKNCTLSIFAITLSYALYIDNFGHTDAVVGGLRPYPVPSSCTKCNSPPINGQCTNFILCHVVL